MKPVVVVTGFVFTAQLSRAPLFTCAQTSRGSNRGPAVFCGAWVDQVLCQVVPGKDRMDGSDKPCIILAYSTLFEVAGFKPGEFKRWNVNNTLFLFYEHSGLWMALKKIDIQDPISICEGLSLLVFFPGSFCSGVFVSPCLGVFSL